MSEQPSPASLPVDSAEDPRLTQALEEYLTAMEAGHLPDRTGLRQRYPEIADQLDGCLEGLEFLHSAATRMHNSSSGALAGLGSPVPDETIPSLGEYEI